MTKFTPSLTKAVPSDGDDILIGSPKSDKIAGLAGADQIFGLDSDDRLEGDSHDDVLSGGSGDDKLDGGSGDDELSGETGADTLDGATGDDALKGGDGNDQIDGDNGDDALDGGDGIDTLFGVLGDDRLSGGDDDDTLNGGSGQDHLEGGSEDDHLVGGADADDLSGGSGGDGFVYFLNGGDGLGGVRGRFVEMLNEGRFVVPVTDEGDVAAAFQFESTIAIGPDIIESDVAASVMQTIRSGIKAGAKSLASQSAPAFEAIAEGLGLPGAPLIGEAGQAGLESFVDRASDIANAENKQEAFEDAIIDIENEARTGAKFIQERGQSVLDKLEDLIDETLAPYVDIDIPDVDLVDPLVADVVLVERVTIGNDDVTDELIALAEADILASYEGVESAELGVRPDTSITFLDPDLFSASVVNAAGEDITGRILGVDTVLLRSGSNTTFGYVAYNDPVVTGAELSARDTIQLDVSALPAASPGSTVEVRGVPVVAMELFAPTTTLGSFGRDRIQDFAQGSDRIEFRNSDLAFDDLDLSVVAGDTVIDLSEQFDNGPGTETITVEGVTALNPDDFLFG